MLYAPVLLRFCSRLVGYPNLGEPASLVRPTGRRGRPHDARVLGLIAALSVVLVSSGCGVSSAEHARVVQERDSLRREVDELKNGAPRLLAAARAALEAKRYEEAERAGRLLVARHPEAPEVKAVTSIIAGAEEALKERAAAVQRAQDSAALATRKAQEAAAQAHADSARRSQARLRHALAAMQRFYDDVEERYFYFDRTVPRSPHTCDRLLLYIVKPKTGAPYLRFSIRYCNDEWLWLC